MITTGCVPLRSALMAALLLLAGCGGGPGIDPTPYDPSMPRLPSEQYVIGPGDQLGIFVYQAPQLSLPSIPVRPDGRISMPLVPEVIAAGKTPTQLGAELSGELKKYVRDPIVTVMVTGFVGPLDKQVRVIGEATDPVAIPYRDGLTVLDVMIQTRGLTRYAAGNSAVIVRRVGGQQKTLKVHLSDLLKDGDISANVAMLPGDTLIIPQSWF